MKGKYIVFSNLIYLLYRTVKIHIYHLIQKPGVLVHTCYPWNGNDRLTWKQTNRVSKF